MLLAVKNKEYLLLEIVSQAVKSMSEGELLQIEKARRLDIAESVYYDIIRQKPLLSLPPPVAQVPLLLLPM